MDNSTPQKIVYEIDPAALEAVIAKTVQQAVQQAIAPKDPFADYPHFLTRKQAAKILGVSLSTIDRLIWDNKITPITIPHQRKRKIVKDEILELIKDFVTEL